MIQGSGPVHFSPLYLVFYKVAKRQKTPAEILCHTVIKAISHKIFGMVDLSNCLEDSLSTT